MTPASEDPHQLSRRTTPTWEMELLISGATVFGLMQLPEKLDRLLFWLFNVAPSDIGGLAMPLWMYLKFALLTLIATFIAHLVMRAYWVALAGLHSVYPEGVHWTKLRQRLGPVYFAQVQARLGDIGALVERADNRASLVFGVGVGMATLMLLPTLIVGVMMLLVWIWGLLGGGEGGGWVLGIAMGVFMLLTTPFGLLVLWDRRRGASLVPGGRAGHWLGRAFRFYMSLGLGGANNALLTLFSSHAGSRRTTALIFAVMIAVFTVVMAQALAPRLGLSPFPSDALPPDQYGTSGLVRAEHYDDQRGDAIRLNPAAHIESMVVEGNWLRLFIPYFPPRHDHAMAQECPAALASPADDAKPDALDARWRARLDCMARLHPLTIDGVAVSVPMDATEDVRTGQRGLLAMIPVAHLAPGRHVLRVDRPKRKGREEASEPWLIPFWTSPP